MSAGTKTNIYSRLARALQDRRVRTVLALSVCAVALDALCLAFVLPLVWQANRLTLPNILTIDLSDPSDRKFAHSQPGDAGESRGTCATAVCEVRMVLVQPDRENRGWAAGGVTDAWSQEKPRHTVRVPVLEVSGKNSTNWSAGDYFVSEVNVSGQGEITVSGPARLFANKICVSGEGRVNSGGKKENLKVYCRRVSVEGNGVLNCEKYPWRIDPSAPDSREPAF